MRLSAAAGNKAAVSVYLSRSVTGKSMKYQTDKPVDVVVRRWGLGDALDGGPDIDEELLRANSLWNKLVELDRSCEAAYMAALAEHPGEAEAAAVLQALYDERTQLAEERRRQRRDNRSRKVAANVATDLAALGAGGSQQVQFRGLRRTQAQAVYRICQSQDQAWREKRRVRELEELRARSGGIQVSPGPLTAGGAGESDAVRRLQEAKQLLDAHLISDAEYEAIKAKIISS